MCMYEFAERKAKRSSGNKAKTKFYSELIIVSTVEGKTMSNSVRKFSELHKFMNFSRESLRWLRDTVCIAYPQNLRFVFLSSSRCCAKIWSKTLFKYKISKKLRLLEFSPEV